MSSDSGQVSSAWNSASLGREGLAKQYFSIHLGQASQKRNLGWLEGKPGEIRVRCSWGWAAEALARLSGKSYTS